jgi:hypothetical protein
VALDLLDAAGGVLLGSEHEVALDPSTRSPLHALDQLDALDPLVPPLVDLPHPPAPAPALACDECGGTVRHGRRCSFTLRAVAN